MKIVHDSLTILMVARNAQTTLARDVERLVEAAAELTSRFELLIVDDGSRDATEEIAWELTTRYSQVRMVRHPRPLGMLAAYRAALVRTSGDFLVVHEGEGAPHSEGLAPLWRFRSQSQAGRTADATRKDARRFAWFTRALASVRGWWSPRGVRPTASNLRLLRRTELAEMDPLADGRKPTYLERIRRPQTISTP